MNKDFHYYATYFAAMITGFKEKQALKIARSAQFVDEYDIKKAKTLQVPQICPTIEELSTMGENEMWYDEEKLIISRIAWTCFHFLPGNLKNTHPYSGVKEHNGVSKKWVFDEESDMQTRLICWYDNELVSLLTNQLISEANQLEGSPDNYPDEFLYAIGIALHTIADTWAHYGFAGIPAWFINNADNSLLANARSYNSFAFVGHGTLGHRPDIASERYAFQPQWSGNVIPKDNPAEHTNAFWQMVEILTCIRNLTIEDHYSYTCSCLPGGYENPIMKKIYKNIQKLLISNTEEKLSMTNWNTFIQNAGQGTVPAYTPLAKQELILFNNRALIQKELIINELQKNKVYLLDYPSLPVTITSRENPKFDGQELNAVYTGNLDDIFAGGHTIRLTQNSKNSYLALSSNKLVLHTLDKDLSAQKWKVIKTADSYLFQNVQNPAYYLVLTDNKLSVHTQPFKWQMTITL